MPSITKLKVLSLDFRKLIFDLYKDTFVCIAIAIVGVYLIKNGFPYIGWLTYIIAGALAILASLSTVNMVQEKFRSEEISKFGFSILLFFSLFSVIILIGGLVKGVKDIL
ncbi:Uncharacterised protein [Salmonella enterica subsp. enterica serovar Sanjuan]|uniref:Uncharacterized protein n=1 Tax=Salmonella enterica subsp. enterica serovar Sanjuan TaxID=1160765 RepID=A0A447NJR6_SALET|nr:Uncharacterised protein [Salmonella enterica subsp. enterica serovar Sanjuan]